METTVVNDPKQPVPVKSVDTPPQPNVNVFAGEHPTRPLPGNMGIAGIWATVGNSTAMVLVGCLLLITVFMIKSMHSEGMGTLERLHQQQRDADKAQSEYMQKTLDRNTTAIDSLAIEMKLLRAYREKTTAKD